MEVHRENSGTVLDRADGKGEPPKLRSGSVFCCLAHTHPSALSQAFLELRGRLCIQT